MRLTVSFVAAALALVFALSLAARGMWWIQEPREPALFLGAIGLFLAGVTATIVAGLSRQREMPLWVVPVAIVVAVAAPSVSNLALDVEMLRAPYATWYIGALGLLGVVCIARRRAIAGWCVFAVLATSSWLWLGIVDALALGLVGSAVWMVIAQLLVLFWDRAVHDTERLADIQRAVSSWQASQLVRQRERRERVQYALSVAGPVFERVIEVHGDLRDDERVEVRIAEGRLRDEIRGANLLNEEARQAISRARRRGATVTVFDEGGLDGLDEAERARVRDELADILRDATAARIIIRSSAGADAVITVVGRSAAGVDEESVELWQEIRRSAPPA